MHPWSRHDQACTALLGYGGPDGGGFATRSLFESLEEKFVVVAWDEPGTGKSYNAMPITDLTPQRFVEDAHALTLMLRERFNQDKIYVYGVSWTSILGIWLEAGHGLSAENLPFFDGVMENKVLAETFPAAD